MEKYAILYGRKTKTAIVSAIVAIFIFGLLLPEPKSSVFKNEQFWLHKTFTADKYDMVIGGDSRVYRGINPAIIEANTQLKGLNFGYSSGGFSPQILQEIEKKLDKNSAHKTILLGITPHSLTSEAYFNGAWKSWNIPDKRDVFLKTQVIPQYFSFFEPLKVTDLLRILMKSKEGYYEVFHANGWVQSFKLPHNPTAALKEYSMIFDKEPIHKPYIDSLTKYIYKWKKEGIRVYAFRPPSTKAMEELENQKSGYSELAIIQAVENAGAKWIDIPNRYDFDSYDGSHLHFQSANKLSSVISEAVISYQ